MRVTAEQIVRAVCKKHENPQLPATDPFILAALDEHFSALETELEAALEAKEPILEHE